jgi:hypothetical protein
MVGTNPTRLLSIRAASINLRASVILLVAFTR